MEAKAKLKILFDELDADETVKARALKCIHEWLEDEDLAAYRPYVLHQIESRQAAQLLDAFWRMMPFGTGGRRGPVGAGPNRINPYTIALSVEGHCQYLRDRLGPQKEISVVVAYDVREFFDIRGLYPGIDGILKNLTSRKLAGICAETYAAHGIRVFVVGPLEQEGDTPATDRFISTPELSFLIRELGACGGLNISASHNHPDDNGGKFYNAGGGQEIPPHDEKLLKVVENVTTIGNMPYAEARKAGLIRFVPAGLHQAYIDVNKLLVSTPSRSAKVAFTPLCGTGTSTVSETLEALLFNVNVVQSQSRPDGAFRSVRYRIGNPEVPDSMDRVRELAIEQRSDIAFATDPDADRLGILVPDDNGDFIHLNGNEIGVLLIESILQDKKRQGTLPLRPLFINTVVTSSLQRRIARRYGCQVVGDLMVGFKYMGDVLGKIERFGRFPEKEDPSRDKAVATLDDFVFTTEEAHGYLLTHRVRDKDACGAAVHLAGLASRLKDEGKSILGMLDDIYRVYGYTVNHLRSLVMEGIVGLERIGRIQAALRESPPDEVSGRSVLKFVDYQKVGGPIQSTTDEASRNVLLFELENGSHAPIRLIIRPSGTEPKTKIYVEVSSPAPLGGTLFDASKTALDQVDEAMLTKLKGDANALAREIADGFILYCLGPDVLGSDYPSVPAECLAISDLVPVDQKIRVFDAVLPSLVERLRDGMSDGDAEQWLHASLGSLGEDGLGLMNAAVSSWICSRFSGKDAPLVKRLKQLLLQV